MIPANIMQSARSYKGTTPVSLPVGLDTPLAIMPREVTFSIDWNDYLFAGANASGAIACTTELLAPAEKLDQIRAIHVSNFGSDITFFVHFPDTQQTIECPPGVTVSPVYTNQFTFVVFGDNLQTIRPTIEIIVGNVNRAGYFIPAAVAGAKSVFTGAVFATTPGGNVINTGYARPDRIIVIQAATDAFIPNSLSSALQGPLVTIMPFISLFPSIVPMSWAYKCPVGETDVISIDTGFADFYSPMLVYALYGVKSMMPYSAIPRIVSGPIPPFLGVGAEGAVLLASGHRSNAAQNPGGISLDYTSPVVTANYGWSGHINFGRERSYALQPSPSEQIMQVSLFR